MSRSSTAPLLLTTDDLLRTELVRLAAAAGVVPDCTDSIDGALRSWPTAPLVLVGSEQLADLAASAPVRRAQVYAVGLDEPPDALFRPALACGADAVLTLPDAGAAIIDLFADSGDGDRSHGQLVGVIGGAGGVGTTTFAAALAETFADRDSALLVDLDPDGAGVDRVLGLDQASGVRWDALAHASGRLSARSLRDALPRRRELSVLSWPLDRSFGLEDTAVREVFAAARRGYPVSVVDLPRRQSPLTEEILRRCDLVLLVSTTTVPAVAAAARIAARLPRASTQVVLRRRGGGDIRDVATLLGLPVLTSMADQRGLDEAIGLGLGPLRSRRGPLARSASLAADLVLTVPRSR